MNKFKLKNSGKYPKLGNYSIPSGLDCKVAVDLGSNIGLFTRKYHNVFDRIYFFEASYVTYINSLAKILSSGIKNSTGFNLAAYSKSGEIIKIHSHSNGDAGSNSILDTEGINSDDYHSVVSISYDDIFNLIGEERINYLKIDIEGAEYDFLKNADLTKVDVLAIEIHNLLGPDKMNKVRNKISKTHELISSKKAIPDICNEESTYILKKDIK